MEKTEITIIKYSEPPFVYEQEFYEGEDAICDGYNRFKEIVSTRADWLLGATVRRDFDNNMTIEIRIKPEE